jgi:hypothetical protein
MSKDSAVFSSVLLYGSMAFLLCCSSAKDNGTAGSVSSVAAPSSSRVVGPGTIQGASRGSCPATGAWALCSVEKRLQRAGFVPRKLDQAGQKRAGFSVAPTTYALGRSTLEVFLYPNAASLERDWSKLDTISGSPRGMPATWPVPPTVLRSVNLAAVYLTESPTQAERLTLALTAGAPQPSPTRATNGVVLPAVNVARDKK